MLGVLEGVLFVVGDEGISKERLIEILEQNENEIDLLLEQLKTRYNNDDFGINIEFFGGKIKLVTKKEHSQYYEKLMAVSKNDNLSQSALETLAIIAYNSPVTRSNVEEIRGVDCTYIIRKLVFQNLIKEVGRSELPGRPILYGITDEFLDYLGLKSLEDLPKPTPIEVEHNEVDLYETNYKDEQINI